MFAKLLRSIGRFWARSIRRQLIIGVALVHAVLMTIFVLDLVNRQHAFLAKERAELGSELARMLAAGTASRVLANDVSGLAEEMKAAAGYPGVRYGMVLDAAGRVLAHTDMQNAGKVISDPVSRKLLTARGTVQRLMETEALIDTAAPIVANDRLVGWARIGLNGNDIAETLSSVALKGAIYTIVAISVGILLASLMAHRLTRGLRKLTEMANRVRSGDRNVRAETERLDEIGELGHGMNNMLDAITRSEQTLRATSDTLGAVIESSPMGIISHDPDQIVRTWNPAAERIFGVSAEEAVGRPYRGVVPDEEMDTHAELVRRVTSGEIIRSVEVKRRRKDGTLIDVSASAAPVYSDGSLPIGIVVAIEDITDRKQAEARIRYLADHDPLTGLPNREQFSIRIGEALDRARIARKAFGVLCVGLDRFANINEALGHSAGDTLLQAVGERLRQVVGPGEVLARLGSNEFAILQPEVNEPAQASALARRVINAANTPFMINGQEVSVGVSVGIAIGPEDSDDPALLLKNAGVALYRAKLDGTGTKHFFHPDMDAQLQTRRTLERDLRKALANGELELHYQPLVTLVDGEVSGCEALLRWRHPERGMISPGEFIAIAEDTNLIVPIGEFVLRQACNDAVSWPGHLKVAVNLSTVQFRSPRLVPTVISALGSSGIAPSRLELEVTESVLMQESDENLAVLHQLRELGVRIAMDDFGTGYSSLGYLRSFPFDKIKIDRSFVKDVPESDECLAIVRAVVGLGKSLGLSTTAEGVETEEQLERIRTEGCNEGQGYLFSRPLPNADFLRFLAALSPAAYRVA